MSTVTVVMMMVVSIIAPRWTPQTSGVTTRLRGVSAVNERIAWASGAGSTVLRTDDGGRASVAFDALQSARARRTDILIADTAGRLHTQQGLMAELGKIRLTLKP